MVHHKNPRSISPRTLATPHGYSHGVLFGPRPRLVFLAGQVGWDAAGEIVSDRFADQFDQALANILAVVAEAGGTPGSIGTLRVFVTDRTEYVAAAAEIDACYRRRLNNHHPAITVVEVAALLEEGARVEIEGLACL